MASAWTPHLSRVQCVFRSQQRFCSHHRAKSDQSWAMFICSTSLSITPPICRSPDTLSVMSVCCSSFAWSTRTTSSQDADVKSPDDNIVVQAGVCYGDPGVLSAARTWTAASLEAALGEQGSRGTAQGYSGSSDVAGDLATASASSRSPPPSAQTQSASRGHSVAEQASGAGRRGHVQPSLLGLAFTPSRRRLQIQ